MSFEKLGLSPSILKAISEMGYETPTPIQQKAIPEILQGKDILAAAQTGTGKTAAFTLPLLELLNRADSNASRKHIKVLIISPTRELAAQIRENIFQYSQHIGIQSAVIFGGVPANPQIRQIKNGLDILIATPGRLLDLENQKKVDLSKVEYLVLDEADRMLDMGFIHDLKRIMRLIPDKRQNLLFSATFSKEIKKLANGFMNNPVSVDITPVNSAAETVDQTVFPVHRIRKAALLKHLIQKNDWHQVLVFSRTKHGANRLAKRLDRAKIPSLALHGNKSQSARTKALQAFKDNKIQVLVATDIAARGIDIEELPYVVNYDLPNVPADYVHRIGRTGRAGSEGKAVTLMFPQDEQKLLRDIERLLNTSIPQVTLDDFDYSVKELPEHVQNNNPRNRGRKDRPKEGARGNSRRSNGKASQEESPSSDNRSSRANSNKERETNPGREKPNSRKKRPSSSNQEGDTKVKEQNRTRSKSSKKNKTGDGSIPEKHRKQKGVAFSKASKNKKIGKKGPFGYGMYPLD